MLVGKEPVPAIRPGSRALQQHLFSLLHHSTSLRKLTQVHAQIIVNSFAQKIFLIVELLSICVKSNDLLRASKIFENVNTPSTTLWNQMIRGYAESEAPEKSVETYNQMVVREAEPDGYTFSYLISACSREGLFRQGKQVHGRIVGNGHCSNVFVQTNLVNLYARFGGKVGTELARKVFDEMRERSIVSWNSLLAGFIKNGDVDEAHRVFHDMPERNVVSWTIMVTGSAKIGRYKQALSLFYNMRRENMEFDLVSLVAALSACAKLGDLELGRWIHSYAGDKVSCRNERMMVFLKNALIHMYASCGAINEAYEVFEVMTQRSRVSWTSMIMGFAKQGFGEDALNLFHHMTQNNSGLSDVRPDEVTFLGVLYACSHAGFVKEGWKLFGSMSQVWGIKPKIEHYGCVVDLLSRAGLFDEANWIIQTMPMSPNNAVWGALLGGCRIHKNVELATVVARELAVELDPDRAAGYLVLLSNAYANAKMWEDVACVRKKMVGGGVSKPSGRSWVQIEGEFQFFVAGDWSHRDSSSIYEMLDRVTRGAGLEGHGPLFSDGYCMDE